MELLSGNEAIAQGAWEAGCRIGVAYPGTPSTETMEAFAEERRRVRGMVRLTRRWPSKWAWARRAAGARVLVHHEARRRERGRRPAVHRVVHRRRRRLRRAGGRRPGHVLVAERAGLALVCAGCAASPCWTPSDSAEALALHARRVRLVRAASTCPFFIRSSVRVSHTQAHLLQVRGARSSATCAPY